MMNSIGKRLMLCTTLMFLARGAMAATCTWTGTWDTMPSNASDVIVVAGGGNLAWSNGMPATVASWDQQSGYTGTTTFYTVYGTTGFTNFTITGDATVAGGAWTHLGNSGGETNRLHVTVGGNFVVSNASLNVDGAGYQGGRGVGGGVAYMGAAYGGIAQGSYGVVMNTNAYGSVSSPTHLGSGGGGGGKGGGAIWLSVAGTTRVETAGSISANGQTMINGAGSGGSVRLATGVLEGNGTIRADGGLGSNGGGSGSGGRVAIILTGPGAEFSTWNGTNTAFGGAGGLSHYAAAGTVYLKTTAGAETLVIDNNGIDPGRNAVVTTLTNNANLNAFSNVVIRRKGVLGVRSDTMLDLASFAPTVFGPAQSYVTIIGDTNVLYPSDWTVAGYTLRGDGITKPLTNVTIATNGVLSHSPNYSSLRYQLSLSIAGDLEVLSYGSISVDKFSLVLGGNLTVHSNASISADSAIALSGPGTGAAYYGAAHGGQGGGISVSTLTPYTYGSVLTPTNLGCAGGGGKGGGAIQLTVAGTTCVETAGSIAASGQTLSNGGGSGGSILLTTGWLTGSGGIRANGGNSGNGGGAGGGGRVAITLTAPGSRFSTWSGSNTAYGSTLAYPSAAGTICLRSPDMGPEVARVVVDNANQTTNRTFTSLPAFTNSTENLTMTLWLAQNRGKIGLLTNATIRSLNLNTSSYLELAGYTLTTRLLMVTNKLYGIGRYTASQLGALVSDSSGGSGSVMVMGFGMVFMVK
jgi:hypothetical protein